MLKYTYAFLALEGSRVEEFTGSKKQSVDILRAVGISLVIFGHCYAGTGLGDLVLQSGWVSVDMFLVLSSFLVATSMMQAMDKGETAWSATKHFYWKRCWRIWPTYYFSIGMAVILLHMNSWSVSHDSYTMQIYLLERAKNDAIHLATFTHNFNMVPLIGSYWSIAVEEHFYLIFPFTFMIFVKGPALFRRYPFASLFVLLAISCGIRAYITIGHPEITTGLPKLRTFDQGFNIPYYARIYMPSWCRLDGLFMGVWLAANFHRIQMKLWTARIVTLASVVAMFLIGSITARTPMDGPKPFDAVVYQFSMVAICAALVLVGLVNWERHAPWKNHRLIKWVSDRIYSIYVVQAMVGFCAWPLIHWSGLNEPARLVIMAVLVWLCYEIGGFLFDIIEKPYMDFSGQYRPVPEYVQVSEEEPELV
jgi:peptidoglycan/LPS O-acetylase OafA/YrhL